MHVYLLLLKNDKLKLLLQHEVYWMINLKNMSNRI